jgi:hypothetical protein
MLTTHIEPTKAGRIRIAIRTSMLILLFVLFYVVIPRHTRTLPPCEALWWHRGEVAATAIFVIAAGIFLIMQNWRALREGQWPLPGTDVLVRVKISRGRRLWLLVANTVAYWGVVAWATSMVRPLLFPYLVHGANACIR